MDISEDNKDAISSYRGNDVLANRYFITHESFLQTGFFTTRESSPPTDIFITPESFLRNTCIFVEELRAAVLADAVPDGLTHLSHILVVLLGWRDDFHAGFL